MAVRNRVLVAVICLMTVVGMGRAEDSPPEPHVTDPVTGGCGRMIDWTDEEGALVMHTSVGPYAHEGWVMGEISAPRTNPDLGPREHPGRVADSPNFHASCKPK